MIDEATRHVLLRILEAGLLRIRAAGFANRADECALEADHLHNLPRLVQSLRPEELRYYFTVERSSFLERTTSRIDDLIPLWAELGELLGISADEPSSAR